MHAFPDARTEAQFDLVRRDDAALRPGVDAVLARHGLGGATPVRFAAGSLPVYAVGSSVLKLFPPCYAHEEAIERGVLEAVEGRLAVPTPEVRASGELEGWRYVVMSHLAGEPLNLAWGALSPVDRDALAAQLGEAMATLHGLAAVAPAAPRPDWRTFLAEQGEGCAERQRARGLSERWAEQIPAFLAAEVPALADAPQGLLHTEIMREHLLVSRTDGGARLSGLFDFEPAMIGAREYDFASVGVFVSCGDARFLGTLLRAYGASNDPARPRRCLAYALLHRYSNLRWYLERVPPDPGIETLEALAEAWWAAQRERRDRYSLHFG